MEAEALRDVGVRRALVKSGAWADTALSCLKQFLREMAGKNFVAEEFRIWMVMYEGHVVGDQYEAIVVPPLPHNPHVWGALFQSAQKKGMIVCTGETRKMQLPKSHARRSLVWRGTGNC